LLAAALNECRAVVSMRLHGAICASLGGTPFALFEYHRKCADFRDDMGQPDAGRLSPDRFPSKIAALVDDPPMAARPPSDYADAAWSSFRALAEIL
jgi:polysaccharide pyruvyl transferase WcaK-like protein